MGRFTIALLALLFGGCAATLGSGAEAEETRDVSGFAGVHVRDGIRVVIEVGVADDFGVSVRADDNFLELSADEDLIATELVGRAPDIALEVFARGSIDPRIDPVVTIRVASLERDTFLTATGDDTRASVMGLSAARFGVAASGGASVVAAGTCTTLVALASDGASLDGEGLESLDAQIDAQGGSEVHATVLGALDVRASGESVIHIHSTPSEITESLTNDSTLIIE